MTKKIHFEMEEMLEKVMVCVGLRWKTWVDERLWVLLCGFGIRVG